MTASGAASYGGFEYVGVRYVVTASAGPHTVNVYEDDTARMVCSVRDPLGAAEPQWGKEWIGLPTRWKAAMLGAVADLIAQWRTELDRGLERTWRLPRPRGGAS